MRIANDLPGGLERLDPLRNIGRDGGHAHCQRDRCERFRPETHLISALIAAGGSKVSGATLSYSMVENVVTISTPVVDCFNTEGCMRSPNFLYSAIVEVAVTVPIGDLRETMLPAFRPVAAS